MKNILVKKTLIYLSCIVLLFSTSSLTAQKSLPKYEGEKIEKLLIIVLVQKLENRVTLADELKYEFSDYGVKTKQSHATKLRLPKNFTKENVLAVCKEGGYDGVLLVKLVDSEQKNGYSYNQRSQYTGGGMPSATSTGVVIGSSGTYSWGQYAYGNYFDTVSSTKIIVQSDIFKITEDYTKEEMIFVADTKMRVGETEEAIGKFSKKLVKKIMKKKLLVTSPN